jgi:hypothetical protein
VASVEFLTSLALMGIVISVVLVPVWVVAWQRRQQRR